ncbi:DUF4190 domain-containing protein [Streptomyces sp. MP131-18]|uniref:DUF4190 domain-containing protein n=1 Tax=Streptomyces sp. MP131-18 TaxID=1857892 RepID=UPI00097C8798|nr:DUF4190 domain-containing protein [Streptomyces sp. MP131-18]ONK13015.1 hypothetical protein STBA_37740 [Streptomyces sp. MP131-18]
MAGHSTGLSRRESSGLSTASLVCGIVGLFFAGIILGTLALVLGAVAYRSTPNGMAKAGMVLGAVDIVLAIVVMATLSSDGGGWVIGG